MSGYPSLLAPLMNTSGLILTSALNTEAQTALAAGVEANAKADTLLATALQTSGQNYTGLPEAGLVLRDVSENTVFYANGTSGDVGVLGVISGSGFANTNSSFQVSDLGNCTVNELTYTTLNPPIVPGATPSLGDVMDVSNEASRALDMTEHEIQNVGSLTFFNGTGSMTGDGNIGISFEEGEINNFLSLTNTGSTFTVDSAGNISCNQINSVAPQFKPTYDYYVAKGGSDDNLGSVLSPFLTVQKAIQVCETAYDGTPRVIHLSSGTYTENITISKPRISIMGEGASMNPDTGSSISGTVLINLTDGNSDLNNNNIYFSGLLINGAITDQTFGVVHRVFFTNCYLYASADVLTLHPAITLDYRVFVNNCSISNSSSSATNSLMSFYGAGMISITNCKITSKGASQKTVYITDNVRVDTFAQNILTSDGTGNNVALCIMQHDSSTTISIGQNAFVYSSSGTKRNTDSASAVNMTSTGSLVALNNIMSLTGLPTGQMAIYNTGTGVVLFGNNISTSSPLGTSASGISGTLNVNKFAATSIQ